MTAGYLVTLGAATPAVINGHWRGVANSVRWARTVPVEQVQEFVKSLPGTPIDPSGQQIIEEHIVTRRDPEHMDVIVPVHLQGSDRIWGLAFYLDADELEVDGEPDWLWGLGEQRLLTTDDLARLKST